jgi:hypothetical protein
MAHPGLLSALPLPWPARRVPDMRNLNNIVAEPIENFIGVADDELHPHIGIVRLISAVWLIL